jgi:hypothetical protein
LRQPFAAWNFIFYNARRKEFDMMNRLVASAAAILIFLGLTTFAETPLAGQEGTFTGTWTASGTYQPLEFRGRQGSCFTFRLSGHVNLKDADRRGGRLWSECAGLWDAEAGSATRCVWRDSRTARDAAYSVLEGRLVEEGVR